MYAPPTFITDNSMPTFEGIELSLSFSDVCVRDNIHPGMFNENIKDCLYGLANIIDAQSPEFKKRINAIGFEAGKNPLSVIESILFELKKEAQSFHDEIIVFIDDRNHFLETKKGSTQCLKLYLDLDEFHTFNLLCINDIISKRNNVERHAIYQAISILIYNIGLNSAYDFKDIMDDIEQEYLTELKREEDFEFYAVRKRRLKSFSKNCKKLHKKIPYTKIENFKRTIQLIKEPRLKIWLEKVYEMNFSPYNLEEISIGEGFEDEITKTLQRFLILWDNNIPEFLDEHLQFLFENSEISTFGLEVEINYDNPLSFSDIFSEWEEKIKFFNLFKEIIEGFYEL
ncbi:MAG: hypothetical protein ACOCWW_03550 [Bacteroidota bacterium]